MVSEVTEGVGAAVGGAPVVREGRRLLGLELSPRSNRALDGPDDAVLSLSVTAADAVPVCVRDGEGVVTVIEADGFDFGASSVALKGSRRLHLTGCVVVNLP